MQGYHTWAVKPMPAKGQTMPLDLQARAQLRCCECSAMRDSCDADRMLAASLSRHLSCLSTVLACVAMYVLRYNS